MPVTMWHLREAGTGPQDRGSVTSLLVSETPRACPPAIGHRPEAGRPVAGILGSLELSITRSGGFLPGPARSGRAGKLASGGSRTGRAGMARCLAARFSEREPVGRLAWHHSGRGSQRNRLIATKPPATPQIARTSSWWPANPRSRANGFSSAWLNGRTGKTPARSLRNREVIWK